MKEVCVSCHYRPRKSNVICQKHELERQTERVTNQQWNGDHASELQNTNQQGLVEGHSVPKDGVFCDWFHHWHPIKKSKKKRKKKQRRKCMSHGLSKEIMAATPLLKAMEYETVRIDG